MSQFVFRQTAESNSNPAQAPNPNFKSRPTSFYSTAQYFPAVCPLLERVAPFASLPRSPSLRSISHWSIHHSDKIAPRLTGKHSSIRSSHRSSRVHFFFLSVILILILTIHLLFVRGHASMLTTPKHRRSRTRRSGAASPGRQPSLAATDTTHGDAPTQPTQPTQPRPVHPSVRPSAQGPSLSRPDTVLLLWAPVHGPFLSRPSKSTFGQIKPSQRKELLCLTTTATATATGTGTSPDLCPDPLAQSCS